MEQAEGEAVTRDQTIEHANRTLQGIAKQIPMFIALFFIFQVYRDVQDLKKADADKWTIAQQSEYALRWAIANPGHSVPDPRDASKAIRVHWVESSP